MATLKFKEASPYTKVPAQPPPEDYYQKIFEERYALRTKSSGEKPVNIALFGVGRAGTIHLSFLAVTLRVKILYIVDDVESKWDQIKNFWGLRDTKFLHSKNSSTVFNDPKVEAVVVASPTFTHEGIVVEALKSKKAVFCEKPIAKTREAAAKCYEIAEAVGKPLLCAFNRRFDPSFVAVRNRVLKGEVGHVHTVKVCARDSQLPPIEYLKISGGIYNDSMVHDIDMLIWILGEFPVKVSVQGHAHIPEIKAIGDHDTVIATLYFPSGTLAVIDMSRNSNYGYDQRVEVFGSKGMITAANEQPIHCVRTQYGYEGIVEPPIWYSFPSRYRLAYETEMQHFLDVVRGKTELSVDALETLAVSKVAAACHESAHTGKMVELRWAPSEIP